VGTQRLDFAEFYRSSRDDCLRTVVVIVGDQDSAQELVAEAFARACASWRTVSRHPAPEAWVVRSAVNLNISRWRRRRREVPVPDPAMLADRPAAAPAAQDPVDPQIMAALLRLPGRQRQVIALRLILDLDTRGTAQVLGITPNTVMAAAFTLTRNTNGTDTLTLTNSQVFDPAALQRALAQHGIPALVKTGTYCSSHPTAPDPGSLGVLSIRPPVKLQPGEGAVQLPSNLTPGARNWIIDHTVTVISPAKMPSGTELFFSYFNSSHVLFFDLIYTSSYTCSNGLPPSGPAGS
jgi:RNA polymerase sigma factor (sigma-70 family)